jgi:hypothetical protein
MSYVAMVTRRFDEVTHFYGELLGSGFLVPSTTG